MFGVAFTPGLLVGTATAGTLELTGSIRLLAVVLGALAAIATVAGIIYGAKWKSTSAVQEALNAALAERVSLVVHERDEAREEAKEIAKVLVDARATIARLEALPNLERVLELIGSTFTQLAERLTDLHADHEKHARERQRVLLAELHKTD